MFDYKKFSVLQYNQILHDWFLGKVPEDTNIFNIPFLSLERNDQVLFFTFEGNRWLKVDKAGWWCQTFDPVQQDVISDRRFFNKNRTSETLGLGHIAYTRRPAKGITYKSIMIKNADITRNNNRVNVNVNRHFFFNVETFKKYKEYQFSTHCGLHYYEKVANNGKVLKTSIRVRKQHDHLSTYNLVISTDPKTKKVILTLNKDYKKESIEYTKFKDCDIDNIYNKYSMFEFDLTAEQEVFEILENVRGLLKEHINNTYEGLKEKGYNTDLISSVLKRIEVIESDEHQIQRST